MATTVFALPAGLQRFSREGLPREPWRNGRGWTRTVAAQTQAHTQEGGPLWRVSLAEIEAASPFSVFPGLDRTAVLVGGGPVVLRTRAQQEEPVAAASAEAGPVWPLDAPGAMARFAGETPIDNSAPPVPAHIWNVMAARGRVQAEVRLCRADDTGPAGQPWSATDTCLVWVLAGDWQLQGLPVGGGHEGLTLRADEGLLWQPDVLNVVLIEAAPKPVAPAWRLHAATPDACLVWTRLTVQATA